MLRGSIALLFLLGLVACKTLVQTSGDKNMQLTSLETSVSKGPRFTSVLGQCRADLHAAQTRLDQILTHVGPRNETNTLVPYNELLIHIDSASSLAGLLSQVHPDKSLRDEAEICEQEVSRFTTDLSLNRPLYDALTKVERRGLDADTLRMLDKTIEDYERSGIDKDEATRAQIKKIEEELVLIGQDFGRNIREDVRFIEVDAKTGLKGLPTDYIAGHKPNAKGKVRVTTDYPDYVPFMMYAESTPLRKDLWTKFNARGYPANEKVLNQLIEKRYELAKLLGYESFADYVVEDKMIKSAPKVSEFIEKITDISTKGADKEYVELLKEKRKLDPKAKEVFGYDKSYLEERVKRAKYRYDSQAVRPYFQFEKVRDGLLDLTSTLFGIRYQPVKDAEVWHSSVSVYDVFDGGNLIGRIYLDLHPRENKYKHAAQFTLKSGLRDRQIPEGALVCNFADPAASSEPALMDHDDVVTFFHEFGHLLHHVLGGQQKWIRFSGVATEWDFVEAPSQLF
jgi:thimet oligopeptidase